MIPDSIENIDFATALHSNLILRRGDCPEKTVRAYGEQIASENAVPAEEVTQILLDSFGTIPLPGDGERWMIAFEPNLVEASSVLGMQQALNFFREHPVDDIRGWERLINQGFKPVGHLFPLFTLHELFVVLAEFHSHLCTQRERIVSDGEADVCFSHSLLLDVEFGRTLANFPELDLGLANRLIKERESLLEFKIGIVECLIKEGQVAYGYKGILKKLEPIVRDYLTLSRKEFFAELTRSGYPSELGDLRNVLRLTGFFLCEYHTERHARTRAILNHLVTGEDFAEDNEGSVTYPSIREEYWELVRAGAAGLVQKAWETYQGLLPATEDFWKGYNCWADEILASVDEESLNQMQPPLIGKSILTLDETAAYCGMSKKRLQNIICDHKKKNGGRLPNWVCNGKGTTKNMVLKDKFDEWRSTQPERRGRPPKGRS